jgi:hypothetical protein
MMTSLSPGGSARIYQFPVGGRAGLRAAHEVAQPTTSAGLQRAPVDVSAWYHAEAIEDAKRPVEH